MSLAPAQPPPTSDSLGEITRQIRRICLLHEQQKPGEAELAERELAALVEKFRAQFGAASLSPATVEKLRVDERRRAADAHALCELLLPQLVSRLSESGAGGSRRVQDARVPVEAAQPTRETAPSGTPAIPDLLDAMLALEQRGARRRRAS